MQREGRHDREAGSPGHPCPLMRYQVESSVCGNNFCLLLFVRHQNCVLRRGFRELSVFCFSYFFEFSRSMAKYSMFVGTAVLVACSHLLGSTVAFLDILVTLALLRECLMAICPFGSLSSNSFRLRTCSFLPMMVTMRSSVNLVIDASGARVLSGWPLVAPFAQRMHCHCFQV